jgi:IS5 family transposase
LVLLEQILTQDIDTDDDGQHEIKQGVAKDRVISTVDPEMRHGRKSASKRFDGYKGHVAVDTDSELVTEVAVTPANVYDGEAVEPLLDNEATHHDMVPQAVVGDQSVIDGERRRILAERKIEAVGKVAIQRPGGRYAKADFDVDLERGTVRCPAGHTVREGKERRDKQGRVGLLFTFPRQRCQDCPQRDQCTTAQRTGRTVRLHPQEALLQAARKEQEKEGFKERYSHPRATVERVISHLVRHGFRQARYFGLAKTLFQALWSAAAVNLQRLMGLMSGRKGEQALNMA